MGNLPRLELIEEKSTLKNNDYIIFRNHDKGKKKSKRDVKIHSKKQIRNRMKTKTKTNKTKTKKNTNKTKKNRNKGFFSIF